MDSVGKVLFFVAMVVTVCSAFVLLSVGVLWAINELFDLRLELTPGKLLAVMFLLVLMGSSGSVSQRGRR